MLTPEILGRSFAEAPDPQLARVAFSRVGDDPGARQLLGRLEILPVPELEQAGSSVQDVIWTRC